MKTLWNRILLLALCVFVFRCFSSRWPYLSLALLCAYWFLRNKNLSFLALSGILLCTMIPIYSAAMPSFYQGRVVSVSSGYGIIQSGRQRIVLYSQEELPFDTVISFSGEYKALVSSPAFYRSDFARTMQAKGVHYSLSTDSFQIVRQDPSFRRFLQKQCIQIQDEKISAFARKILLGISDAEEDSYLFKHGFSLSGILAFLHLILKYILDQKQRNKTVLLAGCGLWLLYGFPLVLSQYLLVHLFRMTKMRKDQALGLTFVILLFLYPESYVSVSFLIPAAFRLCSHFYPRRKSVSLFISLLLQGWFFHGMDPVVSLVYLFVRPLLGFVYLVSLLYLLIPVSLFSQIVFFIDRSLSLFSYFHLPGSIAGAGLLFFLVMIFSMRRLKHASFYMLAVLLVFQCFGLFHPFASVSFINVGQGDAILIKGPLRSFSVLVDTGKPAQWRTLSAFLEGEGIRKLDALIITHGDNDHAGNMDAVIGKYQPDTVLTSHHESMCTGKLCMYDLNDLVTEDENESSLCEYFEMNGVKYLLTGDINAHAEERIVRRYGRLNVDVLKLSHHGSHTGSSAIFLDSLQPSLGIVSAGSYSLYHHPSEEVLQRLLQRHIPWFNTREQGDIQIQAIGPWNCLLTAAGRIGIIRTDE
ncbi:MAG: MBL fold metallo-hydrolase [Erysipelotrichaceae bacterium]|nr:MBL fold metallo-hydrolase [Erysipelotrichaceae bacterium]MCI1385247.1 MBL fold metallo-hydrolase [Solobacterium sp.]MCI1434004.1 MBL fold metallo-hydrolase [Solobacterium sp.]MCI1463285.1 MBL fold metallo-hydrolase [Solobacterium sp.]MCI1558893.1 MBL fold metallo-hydrolase [Solobacterium sp.]